MGKVCPGSDVVGVSPLSLLHAGLVMVMVAGVAAAPQGDIRLESPPSNVVGDSTNELATALMQGFVQEEKDFAFSPLGYSVVLALMAEGAGGQTRNQLSAALRLPEDLLAVRDSYKAILQGMREKWSMNKPQFKNWFYVYKNYTVNDNYKKIIEENYFTEVRQVDRVHYELNFESEKEKEDEKDKLDEIEEENKEEAQEKEEEKEENHEEDKSKNEGKNVDVSSKDKEEKKNGEGGESDVSDNLKESHSLYDGSKDVESALSGGKIVEKGQDLDPQTKMIVFNGFYFRANWKTPFQLVKDDEKRSFYTSASEKTQVTMMHTKGSFDIGTVPDLDACALELPYEGDKYSMLILLPNQRDGLSKLISDISGFSLNKVYKYLVDRPVEVLLPKYQIQTISHPEAILQKYGVNDLFTEEADLSGMSPDKLKMGALVQLVNIQVDEGSSDTNFLTTSLTAGASKRNNVEKFVADHPFLFFIRDYTKNVIVAAGKVLDPKFVTGDDYAP